MDEQLIERIALEVCEGIPLEMKMHLPEYSVRFATRFLARIDAERGKEANAWKLYFRETLSGITDQEMVAVRFGERFSTLGKVVPLFLSPTIPPNMALVPKVATEEMVAKGAHALSEWLDDAAPLHGRRYLDPAKSAWADMLAAVQGERNAE